MEKEKITPSQFSLLVNMFTVGSSILIVPSGLAAEARQDAWVAAIVTIGIGLLLVRLYTSLARMFPGMSLVGYTELILGRWAGKIISLWFFTFCLHFSSLMIRDIGEFVVTHNLPNTPVEVINVIFMCLIIIGTRLGLEPLARTAQIFFPLLFLFFIFSILTLTPQIEPDNIQPFFESGWKPLIRAAFPFVGIPFLELVIFLMIIPYVSDMEKARSSFMKGTLIGAGSLFAVILLSILVLGPDLTAREIYPSYALVKKINVGHFLQRIEAVMAAVWFLTIFIKSTVTFYASVQVLTQTLKLKDHRPLTFPLGMIAVVFSIVSFPNKAYELMNTERIWTFYVIFPGLLLPLLLWGIAKLRKLGAPRSSQRMPLKAKAAAISANALRILVSLKLTYLNIAVLLVLFSLMGFFYGWEFWDDFELKLMPWITMLCLLFSIYFDYRGVKDRG